MKPIFNINVVSPSYSRGTSGTFGAPDKTPLKFKQLNSAGELVVVSCDPCATEVVIPDTFNGAPVVSIGARAFKGCENLTSVTIPNSVTKIRDSAFMGCTSLTDITIPSSVDVIRDSAFSRCINLTRITINNPDCDIERGGADSYTINNEYDEDRGYYYDGVICGRKGSTAQKYAEVYGFTFEDVDDNAGDAGVQTTYCDESGYIDNIVISCDNVGSFAEIRPRTKRASLPFML